MMTSVKPVAFEQCIDVTRPHTLLTENTLRSGSLHQNAREAPAFMPGREKRVQRELHIGIRVDVIVNTG